jgi:hypothetical protein
LIEGRGERIVQCLLGEIEIAEETNQRGENPARFRAIDLVNGRLNGHIV